MSSPKPAEGMFLVYGSPTPSVVYWSGYGSMQRVDLPSHEVAADLIDEVIALVAAASGAEPPEPPQAAKPGRPSSLAGVDFPEALRCALEDGLTQAGLAERLEVSVSTVRRELRRRGLTWAAVVEGGAQ